MRSPSAKALLGVGTMFGLASGTADFMSQRYGGKYSGRVDGGRALRATGMGFLSGVGAALGLGTKGWMKRAMMGSIAGAAAGSLINEDVGSGVRRGLVLGAGLGMGGPRAYNILKHTGWKGMGEGFQAATKRGQEKYMKYMGKHLGDVTGKSFGEVGIMSRDWIRDGADDAEKALRKGIVGRASKRLNRRTAIGYRQTLREGFGKGWDAMDGPVERASMGNVDLSPSIPGPEVPAQAAVPPVRPRPKMEKRFTGLGMSEQQRFNRNANIAIGTAGGLAVAGLGFVGAVGVWTYNQSRR